MITLMLSLALTVAAEPATSAPLCQAVADVLVHAPDGAHAGWSVVWSAGRITAVGPAAPPAGCLRLSVPPGSEVTAAWIAVGTTIGLVGIDQEGATHDDAGSGAGVHASFVAAESYDPRSVVIPVTRLGGVGSTVLFPNGGLVAGQAGAARLTGDRWSEAVTRVSVGLRVNPGDAGSFGAGLQQLSVLLADAVIWSKAGGDAAVLDSLSAPRTELEALLPVTTGKVPLIIAADRASDIEAVLRFARAHPAPVVIAGGAEAWLVADLLAAQKVAVILDPLVYGAGSFDQVHGREDNAALLAAAGVPVIIGPGSSHNARAMRFVAGNAVRGGLDHEAALRAITQVPADVFGLAGVGRIEAGAIADLAVWTGDPLDTPTRLDRLILNGVTAPDHSRQTELVDAWRTVPRTRMPTD